jgi:acetate kinase
MHERSTCSIWQGGRVNVFVVNAGSSSLKLRLLDGEDNLLATRDLPHPAAPELSAVLESFCGENPDIDGVGHRVVHGGSSFKQPILLDPDTDAALDALADLAPLHNPPALAAIEAMRSLRPDLPQVACFDTTFHVDMPPKAATYAVPKEWRERWDIRRFGFHGLSHSWASRRAGELLGQPRERLRLVTAHLGAGASLAAVSFGRSVDTTMGFTPMEGLVMATRSGSVDPGLLLWVQRRGGFSVDDVEDALERQSGLLGLSGEFGDLRRVIAAADEGDESATLAYEVFVYRIQTNVAAMCAAMEGTDGLVFTGGAGEASARLRADVCGALSFLGVELATTNETARADGIISPPRLTPTVLVVNAREDLEIARHVRELLE